jgi:hypothetical protein
MDNTVDLKLMREKTNVEKKIPGLKIPLMNEYHHLHICNIYSLAVGSTKTLGVAAALQRDANVYKEGCQPELEKNPQKFYGEKSPKFPKNCRFPERVYALLSFI